jgi:hypothetical protein
MLKIASPLSAELEDLIETVVGFVWLCIANSAQDCWKVSTHGLPD